MKILHICAVVYTVKNLLLPQINYFSSRGVSVEVICSPEQDVEVLQKQGYVIHPIQLIRQINLLANLVNIIQLTKLIQDNQYDLVHVHTPIAAVLGRISAKLAGTKRVVYTSHGFPFHDQSSPAQYWFYFTIEKLSALMTDKILTQSSEDLYTAQKLNLCSPKKLNYLGNGIDIERFSRVRLDSTCQLQLRQSLNISDTAQLIIGTIGRLTYKKGSGFLIEAIAKLLPEFPNLQVIVIGGQVKDDPEPFQAELIKLIHQLGVEKHVTLTGYRQDTPELLGLFDIFTLPTFTHEGLPRSILEAMAMELPVVATDIRGCREAVVHRKTGLIVPPRNSDELAKALKNLLLDPHLRQSYGKAGRARVESEYDERLVFERLRGCYQELGILPS